MAAVSRQEKVDALMDHWIGEGGRVKSFRKRHPDLRTFLLLMIDPYSYRLESQQIRALVTYLNPVAPYPEPVGTVEYVLHHLGWERKRFEDDKFPGKKGMVVSVSKGSVQLERLVTKQVDEIVLDGAVHNVLGPLMRAILRGNSRQEEGHPECPPVREIVGPISDGELGIYLGPLAEEAIQHIKWCLVHPPAGTTFELMPLDPITEEAQASFSSSTISPRSELFELSDSSGPEQFDPPERTPPP